MTVFIGMHERTSGMIRGIQVSEKIPNARFIDIRNVSEIKKIKNEKIIFIRQLDLYLVDILKNNGCIVGFDLLDRPVADHHKKWKEGKKRELDWSIYNVKNVDFMICNNTTTKEKLKKYYKKDIMVIPHHTVNYENKKKKNTNISVIGYIGIPDQMMLQKEILQLCDKYNLVFVNQHPNTRSECENLLLKIDIGVIYLDSDGYRDYVLKYKPNAKISNFQSYGIPTIACLYDSYIEFGGDAWIGVDNKEIFLYQLEFLIHNKNEYSNLCEKSYEVGKFYNINNIINSYYSFLL
jgi:hypothetical protein